MQCPELFAALDGNNARTGTAGASDSGSGGRHDLMEKLAPSSIEAACGLGQAGGSDQLRRFSQRAHGAAFYAMRRGLAMDLGVPLAGVAAPKLDFIDEFHLTAPALALQADAVAAAMV